MGKFSKHIIIHLKELGVIGTLLIFLSSCDGIATGEFKYINETDYVLIMIDGMEGIAYTLKPDSSIVIRKTGKVAHPSKPTTFVLPLIDSLVFDDTKCLALSKNEGPNNMDDFGITELETSYFEFTYKFTEEDYLQAEDCN